MALPDDFDLAAFLKSVDLNSDLRGMRVVYFDGVRMIELREGPPYCQVGLMTLVIQISQAIRNQLRDALGAALSFSGSATSGLVRREAQYVVGLARSVEAYQ